MVGRMSPGSTHSAAALVAVLATGWLASDVSAQSATEYRDLLDDYCVTCHNQRTVDGPIEQTTALRSQLRVLQTETNPCINSHLVLFGVSSFH